MPRGRPGPTDSVAADGGDAAAAVAAMEAELAAVRALPFVESARPPALMAAAESGGELFAPDPGAGPWTVRARVRGPPHGPYDTRYTVAVKCNAAWPRSPPEVRFHGVIHHTAIAHDGLVDPDALYAAAAAGSASPPGAGMATDDDTEQSGKRKRAGELRFGIGDRVLCNCSGGWRKGRIVALHYREPDWPPSRTAPYQVQLDGGDGVRVFVPEDAASLCRRAPAPAAPPATLCDTLRGVYQLLVDGGDAPEAEANGDRLDIIAQYERQRKHRDIFDEEQVWDLGGDTFDPTFRDAARQGSAEAWRGLLHREADGVYSFPMFTPAFCDRFIEELYNFYASGLPARRPNSMNNYGVIVNEIGMEAIISRLQSDILQPIAHTIFPGVGSHMDHHHSFIVRYKMGEDLGLDMHTDDSDVTFNICLGKEFAGAGLQFCGKMGAADHRKRSHRYYHKKGQCVVHLGRQRHGADDITEGERLNLIVWNHNSEYRRTREYDEKGTFRGAEQEVGKPDPECLSFTHDRDYGVFKKYTTKTAKHQGRGWCPPPQAEYPGFKAEKKGAARAADR